MKLQIDEFPQDLARASWLPWFRAHVAVGAKQPVESRALVVQIVYLI